MQDPEAIALVTGASSGIGRALTWELAGRGIPVLGVGRRRDRLEETRIRYPDQIKVVASDLASPEGRAQVSGAVASSRRIRFLVHNAGLLTPIKRLEEVKLDDWRYHQAVNVEAPLFLTQRLLPCMTPGARILHISSGAAHKPYAGWGAYCVSKAALFMLYMCLREELAGRDIYIGSARPGVVDTRMQSQIRQTPEDVFPSRQRFVNMKEQGELLSPERSARFLAWLLIETEPEEFTKEEWDARDAGHHPRWEKRPR